jgi:hypothetical protein
MSVLSTFQNCKLCHVFPFFFFGSRFCKHVDEEDVKSGCKSAPALSASRKHAKPVTGTDQDNATARNATHTTWAERSVPPRCAVNLSGTLSRPRRHIIENISKMNENESKIEKTNPF